MELNESQQSLTTPSSQKPIIFSPPNLNDNDNPSTNNNSSKFQFSQQFGDLPNDFNPNRQQSVGYNLQHEFETLTAELDLDLNNNNINNNSQMRPSQSAPPNQEFLQQQQQSSEQQSTDLSRPSTNSNLIAPSASKLNSTNPSSNLLNLNPNSSTYNKSKEINSLSPTPNIAGTNPQISSLLDNKGFKGATGSFLNPQPPSASIPDRPQSANDFTNIFSRAGHAFTSFNTPSVQQPTQQQQQQIPQQQQQQQQIPTTSQQPNNFYSDLLIFSNWIENLNPQDTISMIDYLCASLPIDILLTFQAKLDNHLQTNKQTTIPQYIMSPYNNNFGQDFLDLENLNLNDQKNKFKQQINKSQYQQHQQHQQQNNNYLNVDKGIARPKSADPFLHNQKSGNHNNNHHHHNHHNHHHQNQNHSIDRSKSPTSHLYEKTNFLQLAAANPNNSSQYYYNQYGNAGSGTNIGNNNNNNNNGQLNNQTNQNSQFYSPQSLNSGTSPGNHQDENLDMSNTALKLGALTTINSRVALDSNRKHPHSSTNTNWSNQQQQHQQQQQQHNHHNHQPQISPQGSNNYNNFHHLNAMNYEDSLNRISNSSSVPTTSSHQINNNNRNNFNSSMGLKNRISSPISTHMQQQNISTSSLNSQTGTVSSSSMPNEVSSIDLLNNIPAWLKLLRLHKYTDFLKDIYWKELIELDNDALEEKGVAALGARRKLLKAFEMVKEVHGDTLK
ncbi:VTS1 [Candida jiufengensis]|uniref:VTS1 n=1 Tax=Candida jiufengensis TaxID=497108 RepID=UPI002224C6AB|nr:VTS1 [Candida jiufengensis]KAI5953615.1 VTS1 [Candida jiufengensis]